MGAGAGDRRWKPESAVGMKYMRFGFLCGGPAFLVGSGSLECRDGLVSMVQNTVKAGALCLLMLCWRCVAQTGWLESRLGTGVR